ncbi:MAG: hypothetical protein WCJ58_06830 [bacterium]
MAIPSSVTGAFSAEANSQNLINSLPDPNKGLEQLEANDVYTNIDDQKTRIAFKACPDGIVAVLDIQPNPNSPNISSSLTLGGIGQKSGAVDLIQTQLASINQDGNFIPPSSSTLKFSVLNNTQSNIIALTDLDARQVYKAPDGIELTDLKYTSYQIRPAEIRALIPTFERLKSLAAETGIPEANRKQITTILAGSASAIWLTVNKINRQNGDFFTPDEMTRLAAAIGQDLAIVAKAQKLATLPAKEAIQTLAKPNTAVTDPGAGVAVTLVQPANQPDTVQNTPQSQAATLEKIAAGQTLDRTVQPTALANVGAQSEAALAITPTPTYDTMLLADDLVIKLLGELKSPLKAPEELGLNTLLNTWQSNLISPTKDSTIPTDFLVYLREALIDPNFPERDRILQELNQLSPTEIATPEVTNSAVIADPSPTLNENGFLNFTNEVYNLPNVPNSQTDPSGFNIFLTQFESIFEQIYLQFASNPNTIITPAKVKAHLAAYLTEHPNQSLFQS